MATGLELLDQWVDFEAGMAIEAGGLASGTVQLQYAAAAGHLMQAVDILGDDPSNAAGRLPARQDLVACIGLRGGEFSVHFGLLPPVFVAGFGAREEFLEVHGTVLGPHA